MNTPFKNYNLISIDDFIRIYKLEDDEEIICTKLGKGKTRAFPKPKLFKGGNKHEDK